MTEVRTKKPKMRRCLSAQYLRNEERLRKGEITVKEHFDRKSEIDRERGRRLMRKQLKASLREQTA